MALAWSPPSVTGFVSVTPTTIIRNNDNKRLTSTIRSQPLYMINSPLLQFEGLPSKPGWQSGRLERLSEWAVTQKANRNIIGQYNPSGFWLWSRFKGTVLKLVWGSVLLSMATSFGVDFMVRSSVMRSSGNPTWGLLSIPPATEPLIMSLRGLENLWTYQLSLCSLVLTFFTSLAFAHWQKVYNTSRMIQGRINDFCMVLSMSADRMDTTLDTDNPATTDSMSTTYTPQSLQLTMTITRLLRMSHTLFWAATPTTSNGLTECEDFLTDADNCHIPIDNDHIGPIMLSRYGLKALQESKQLTKQELKALLETGLPPSQYPFVLLEWCGIYVMKGLHGDTRKKQTKLFVGGPGLEQNLLQQLTQLRASMFDIDDYRAGRMPLAYVQLVQILVDSLIIMAPFALYPELGTLSIPLSGLLALFFRGLLALSKSFLDPFGVEGFADQTMKVDVLVSELNFGASKRWLQAGAFLPKPEEEAEAQ